MLNRIINRLRRFVSVALGRAGVGKRRVQVARATIALKLFFVVLAIIAIFVFGWWAALAFFELAIFVGLVGLFVTTSGGKSSKPKRPRNDDYKAKASPQFAAALSQLPEVTRKFRAAGAAQPPSVQLNPTPLPALSRNPLVTIVIPSLNEEAHINTAVRSALAQTYNNIEVIAVDDGSWDKTGRLLSGFAADDARVRVVKHTVPLGLSAGRNAGIARARGELIVFLDGDDALHPEAIGSRLSALIAADQRLTVGAAGGCARVPAEWRWADREFKARNVGMPTSIWTVGVRSPWAVHQVMLRRDVFDIVGCFDETKLHGAEDLDLWLRLLRSGYVVAEAPTVDCYYRQKAGSMIDSMRLGHLDTAIALIRGNDSGQAEAAIVPGDASTDRVAAERIAGWSMQALLAGEPDEAVDVLRRMTPAENLALRASVDLRSLASNWITRTHLRSGGGQVKDKPLWDASVTRLADAVREVVNVAPASSGSNASIPSTQQGVSA